MSVTAWKYAGTGSSVTPSGGGTAWSNPTRVVASDNSYSTCAMAAGANSRFLRASSFGFTSSDIPSGSTIDSIEVEVEGKASAANAVALYGFLDIDATPSEASNAEFWPDYTGGMPTSDAAVSINSSDWSGVWGIDSGTPTQAQVTASAFGAWLIAYNNDSSSRTASIDGVRMRITYTAPAGGHSFVQATIIG